MAQCPFCQATLTNPMFCEVCRRPIAENSAQAFSGGVAVAGPNARVKVTHSGSSWDARPQTRFESTEKPVSGWLELVASVITLGAAALSGFSVVDKIGGEYWWVLFLVGAVIAFPVGFLTVNFTRARFTGHSVVRLGGWVLGLLFRRGTRQLVWSRPVAVCMLCPAARNSVMKPQWRDGAAVWVCKTSREHVVRLDWTQL